MASTASSQKPKKTTTKKATTKKATTKKKHPELRTDINEAGSWPFPVYTRS